MYLQKPALTVLLLGTTLATFAPMSQAEAPAPVSSKPPAFEQIDRNGDGAISKDEAKDSWLAQTFAKVDTNGDGYVTKSEYESAS